MHRLRYHSGPLAAAAPPAPGASRPRGREPRTGPVGRSGVTLLAMAIVALLAGGAFAATRSGADGLSTAELTAAANRATLAQADFPAGWTADPPDEDDGPDEAGRALAECVGRPYNDSPTAAESSFSSERLTAGSEFSMTPSVEWARADFAALIGDAAPGCFEKVMDTMLGADAGSNYDISVTRLDTAPMVPPAAAPDATGLRATITARRGELTLPMTFDAVMIRHDRIEATLTFTSVGNAAFPADLMRSLTGVVVNRLAG